MKQFVPEGILNDTESEGEELDRTFIGLVDDQDRELATILPVILLTVAVGTILVIMGVLLNFFWGI